MCLGFGFFVCFFYPCHNYYVMRVVVWRQVFLVRMRQNALIWNIGFFLFYIKIKTDVL